MTPRGTPSRPEAAGQRPETGRVTFGRVLQRPDYRRVWLSQGISYIGDRFTQVALMLYVLDLARGSAAAVGYALVAQSVPVIVLGLFAGVFADRWDKRKTMVACDLVRAAVIAAAPLARAPTHIYAVAFLMSAVTSVFDPALRASVPELLHDRDEILVANSLMYSTKYFTDILGFTLAGLAVAAIGVRAAFLVDAASFVASAALLVRIRRRLAAAGPPRPLTLRSVAEDLAAGFRYHARNPVVLSLLVSFAVGVLAMGGLNTLLVVGVKRLLGVGDFWWSFLLATQAVAMFLAVTALGRWGQKVPKPYLILPGFFGIGAVSIGLGLCRSLPAAFGLYALLGVANTAFLVPSLTWIQEVVPFEFRGRVFALRGVTLNLANIASCAVAGPLGDSLGVTPTLVGAGALLCLTGFFSAFLPGFRDAFRPGPGRPAGKVDVVAKSG